MKRVKIVAHGDVQGVFFRHHAKKEADQLEIKGWCRNEPDGTVFMIAEGENKNVDKFVKWAKSGPPLAEVAELEVIEEKYTGTELIFEIR